MGAYGGPPIYVPPPKKKRFGWVAITLAFLIGGFVSFVITVAGIFAIGLNYQPATDTHPAAGEGAALPKVGDCLTPPPRQVDVTSTDDVADCDDHHGTEIAAVLEVPGGSSRPGKRELSSYADDACTIAFEGYVGLDARHSVYDYLPVVPDPSAWQAGDTTLFCLVNTHAALGTVRNSHE